MISADETDRNVASVLGGPETLYARDEDDGRQRQTWRAVLATSLAVAAAFTIVMSLPSPLDPSHADREVSGRAPADMTADMLIENSGVRREPRDSDVRTASSALPGSKAGARSRVEKRKINGLYAGVTRHRAIGSSDGRVLLSRAAAAPGPRPSGEGRASALGGGVQDEIANAASSGRQGFELARATRTEALDAIWALRQR